MPKELQPEDIRPNLNLLWDRFDSYLDVILRGIKVFVNLSKTSINIPQKNETQSCSSTHHAYEQHSMFLIDHIMMK
jgi:hypothetical protein